MSKTKEHLPTILIMNGRPYQLKKLNRQGINSPCELCDLRTVCNNYEGYTNFYKLCTSDDRNGAWYFEEDWTIFDKPLCDFIAPELANDFLDK